MNGLEGLQVASDLGIRPLRSDGPSVGVGQKRGKPDSRLRRRRYFFNILFWGNPKVAHRPVAWTDRLGVCWTPPLELAAQQLIVAPLSLGDGLPGMLGIGFNADYQLLVGERILTSPGGSLFAGRGAQTFQRDRISTPGNRLAVCLGCPTMNHSSNTTPLLQPSWAPVVRTMLRLTSE